MNSNIYLISVWHVYLECRMKALDRLNVFVLGDRLHRERRIQKKAEKRLQEKEMILKVTEPTKRIVYGVKESRHTVEPGPNAPLLKRIVKSPCGLDVGFPQRIKIPRAVPEPRLVYNADNTLKEYFKADKKIRKMRPMALHHKAACVEIPSIDSWASGLRRKKQEAMGFDFSKQ